ncbi:lysophosphatidylcholine acyltransferase [Trichogramma pretiosum]|uniref:lysophosphatidylcholine acyltransferase n=1 Tax=Trichogramma pretiosum TaxID=7493 RepID=UPI0006C9A530|nr:lysophosphatidylcholine acyltransferase [Trichogramma pretiosum]
MRYRNEEIIERVVTADEIINEAENGKLRSATKDNAETNYEQQQQQQQEPVSSDIINPFVHRLELETTYEKIKTLVLTVTLLPIRLALITALVIIAWLLACVGLHGLSEEDLRRAPLKGWRRELRTLVCSVMRVFFICGGFCHVRVKGRQATNKEAPILALAPHSTFFDSLPVIVLGGPSIVAKAEVSRLPFFGKLINYTQPVYVWRDDPNSRQNTVKEIIERATSKEDWPQVMIFPEGTCTNRSCLITFKSGAFYPGVPVQPVCIKYPNKLDTVTWTWEGPGALKILWLTLTQWNSMCEIEFLPVYKPSEAEKLDPKLYANNVRRLMAKTLGVPVSDYTYDDCKVISKAQHLHIPHASTIVELYKLRSKLGLLKENTEEELVIKKCQRFPELVDYPKFVRLLKLDENNTAAQHLFKINDKHNRGMIDFEEYVFIVMAIANANDELDMVRVAFEVCSSDPTYHLNAQELRKALHMSLSLNADDSDRIFQQIQRDQNCTTVNHDQVLAVMSTRPEFSHLFHESNELKRKKKSI